jgi:iron complex outermembrane receptor protein
MKKAVLGLLLTLVPSVTWSGEQPAPSPRTGDLMEMSIEDLMKLQVTTASKRAQALSSVPAAVYVVTQEDIRRSGLTSIPELLRMVPGMLVAQIDENKWSVASRGFNSRFVDKMLVLVDGRSVYTPLFSGVFWDSQDLLLEDIDRIEVIRGPGGSLWGANAVNGIINIITKSAQDTQGTMLHGGLGEVERGFAGFRHGSKWGNDGFYRVYAKYFTRDNLLDITGMPAPDQWDVRRGGFRVDKGTLEKGKWMAQGDIYKEHLGQRSTIPTLTAPFSQVVDDRFPVSGANALARWERKSASGTETSVQVYFDHTDRDNVEVKEVRDTFDLDFQQRLTPRGRHSLIYGGGYRRSKDRTQASQVVAFNPANRTVQLYSAFVHDEIALKKNTVLTLGSKFEHNSFSGFEVQPNVRVAWTPDDRRTLWAALSRAVRTPNRIDHDIIAQRLVLPPDPNLGNVPILIQFPTGDRSFQPEKVIAYEVGYRVRPSERVLLDVAAFYNHYTDLRTREQGAPSLNLNPVPHLVVPFTNSNKASGHTSGVEVAGRWTVNDRWRLLFAYAQLRSKLRFHSDSTDPNQMTFGQYPVFSPNRTLNVRSYLDLPGRLELDAALYAVGRVSDINVPGYTRLDVRLGWRPKENLEISLVGQNLLKQRHQEDAPSFLEVPSQIERSLYAKVTWKW